MARTLGFEARAVVPTTLGFTSATPKAGRMMTTITMATSGTLLRIPAIHVAPREPSRKYETVKMK